jgi:hypothetical protein
MITTIFSPNSLTKFSEVSKHEHQAAALRKAIQAARNAGVGHVTFQMEAAGHRGIGDQKLETRKKAMKAR